MNTAQNVYITHKTAFSGFSSQILREGSSVFVRIISKTGARSYEASVSGSRFSVSSQAALKPGSTFTATVLIRNGKIALVPQPDAGLSAGNNPLIQNFSAEIRGDGLLADQRLAAYFMSFGLVPDAVTLMLFNEMKELGMRFDPSLLNKTRRMAQSFPDREKEAAEAALILEQKGISPEESAVEAVLGTDTDNDMAGGKKDAEQQGLSNAFISAEEDKAGYTAEDIVDEVHRYFSGIFNGIIPGGSNREGMLTVFNHRGFFRDDSRRGSWIQIPFEISLDGGNKQGKGLFRCFLEKDFQKDKKIVIKIDFDVKSYFFVLYYNQGLCKKIRFRVFPDSLKTEREKLKKNLQILLKNIFHCDEGIQIGWGDPDCLSGFCTNTEQVSVVRGAV